MDFQILKAGTQAIFLADIRGILAGDESAREHYDKQRIFSEVDIPLVIRLGIAEEIKAAVHSTSSRRLLTELIFETSSGYDKIKSWEEILRDRGEENLRIEALSVIADSGYKAEMGSIEGAVRRYERIAQKVNEGFNRVMRRMLSAASAAVFLSDFSVAYSYEFSEREMSTLSYQLWDFRGKQPGEYPLMRSILRANSELAEIFDQLQADDAEKSNCIHRFVKGGLTSKAKQEVEAWLAERRNPSIAVSVTAEKAVPEETVIPQLKTTLPNNLRKQIKQFVRGLSSLTREQQNDLGREIYTVTLAGSLDFQQALQELETYPAVSPADFIRERLPKLVLQPHSGQEIVPKEPTPTLLPMPEVVPEAVDTLLERLATASIVEPADIQRLKTLLLGGQVPTEHLDSTLEHCLCAGLAYGAKSKQRFHGRPYRIRLDSLVCRYLPHQYQPLGKEVVNRLIREGKIVARSDPHTRPTNITPVKLAPPIMYKYKTGS